MRALAGQLLCLASALIACTSDRSVPDGADETLAVEVRVGTEGIEIRDVQPISRRRIWHHVQALTSLEYRLVDRDGDEVLRGRTPDFRWARSEEMDPATGTLTSAEFRLGSAVGTLRLPAIAGELVILEPTADGTVELGRAAYDPTPIAALRRPLDDDEVLGDPIRLAGGGLKEGAIDILLVPEAYQEDQLTRFHQTAAQFVDEFLYQADFADYQDRINVYYIDVASKDDQIDSGGLFGDHHDSAFDGRWGGGGFLGIGDAPDNCITYGESDDARDLGTDHEMDAVVMIANVDGVRGLAADDIISLGRDSSGVTMAHELGHLLLDLGDEYTEDMSGFEDFRCGVHSFFGLHERANVQADTEDLPWWDLLTPGVPLPTDEEAAAWEVVGAFEGANHCESGWYRPQQSCLMRDHASMCAACRRELDFLMGALSTEPPSCPEEWRDDGICDLCLDDDPDCDVKRVCDGDGTCDENEHCSACPEDCGDCPIGGSCGDGACAHDETDSSCPVDCGCAAEGGQCDGTAPYGCYCDAQCEDSGDCCADYTPACE